MTWWERHMRGDDMVDFLFDCIMGALIGFFIVFVADYLGF